MAIKLPRVVYLAFLFITLSCQETDEEVTSEKNLTIPFTAIGDLADQITLTEKGAKLEELNEFFKSNYELNFESEYECIKTDETFATLFPTTEDPANTTARSATAPAPPRNIRPQVYTFGDNALVGSRFSAAARERFLELYNVIDVETENAAGTYELKAKMRGRLKTLRSNLKYDKRLSSLERESLIARIDACDANIDAIS